MKAVLKSIKPYFAYLLIKGLKSLELSKTQPQDEDFSGQVFIYFTKDKKSFNKIPKDEREIFKKYIGKICGCFTCDRILIDKTFGHDPNFIGQANLSQIEAAWYCTQNPIYGWHISDLKIYDEPKVLSEFVVPTMVKRTVVMLLPHMGKTAVVNVRFLKKKMLTLELKTIAMQHIYLTRLNIDHYLGRHSRGAM